MFGIPVALFGAAATAAASGPRINTKIVDKKKVKQKAERLLRRTLPPREHHRYRVYGHVRVTGSEGGLYKLTKSRAYNVYQLKPKKRTMCAVPADVYELDYADIIVAQYLALINDEKKFVKTANIQGGGAADMLQGLADITLGNMAVANWPAAAGSDRTATEAAMHQQVVEQHARRAAQEIQRRITTDNIEVLRRRIMDTLIVSPLNQDQASYVLGHIREYENSSDGNLITGIEISNDIDTFSTKITCMVNNGSRHNIYVDDRVLHSSS